MDIMGGIGLGMDGVNSFAERRIARGLGGRLSQA